MRPLVDPGPPLTPAEAVRFSRHTVLPLLGEVGQRRLRNARVCVVGAGGLGSPALLYLAAAGVGTLGIVDRDEVDLSNLQRQVIHTSDDVGRSKVASARRAVLALDGSLTVRAHDEDLTPQNALDVLGGYDLVLDGTDNFPTRYLVNDACAALGIPLVWGSVLGFDAQVAVFWSAPPDPDVPAVDLRDLFPDPPPAHEVPSCAEAGVVGALCGQVGSLMATEAVKVITGAGDPLLGRVLTLDALRSRWREVPLRRAPDRVPTPAPPASGVVTAAGPGPACAPAAPAPSITAAELAERLGTAEAFTLLDVREPHEHEAGAIRGSRLVPLAALRTGAGAADLPAGPLVLYCAAGVRSAEALQILRAAGRGDAVHLAGGIQAWTAHLARAQATSA